jgi:hypothetical protein
MQTTLKTIVNDISIGLGQITDDKKVLDIQIAHWVIMLANRIKSQHIGKRDSGAFLSIFADVPIQTFLVNSGPNQVKGRKYIKLPACIYDYDRDEGIDYVSFYLEDYEPNCPPPFTVQTLGRTTPIESQRLYYSRYEKPAPDNAYFYRVGDYIYLLGLECVNAKSIEIGIYASLKPVTDPTLNWDEPFDFPEETIPVLTRQVLDLGRFILLIPQERVNDGATSSTENVPTNKIVSVNELKEDITQNK